MRRDELRKFIPMVLILFCVLFNFTMVRILKDALVVTALVGKNGARVIPYIKLYYVIPGTALFILMYAKLSNTLSKRQLYCICLVPFLIFFFLFGFFIYPYHDILHGSTATLQKWQKAWPSLEFFFPTITNWSYTLFYVAAEMWANVAINILFWQFVNHITKPEESKRFYPVIGMFAYVAPIFAGLLSVFAGKMFRVGEHDFGFLLKIFTGFVVFFGLATWATYLWMGRYVLTDPRYYDEAKDFNKGREERPKLSLVESCRYLMKSRYLGYIVLLILGHGITINITEVLWKDQAEKLFSAETAFSAFMGWFFAAMGVVTTIVIFVSKNFVKRFGWKFSASVTPLVTLILGALFFLFVLFPPLSSWVGATLGCSAVMVVIAVGFVQNVVTLGTKYGIFDATREMTYVPLDEEMKVKGQAALNVIGGRIAKGSGSFIQIILMSILGSSLLWGDMGAQWAKHTLYYPCLAFVFFSTCFVWLWAVGKLSNSYQEKLVQYEQQHAHPDECQSSTSADRPSAL